MLTHKYVAQQIAVAYIRFCGAAVTASHKPLTLKGNAMTTVQSPAFVPRQVIASMVAQHAAYVARTAQDDLNVKPLRATVANALSKSQLAGLPTYGTGDDAVKLMNPDLQRAIEMINAFTEPQIEELNKYGFAADFAKVARSATNIKVSMRIPYLAGFIAAGDGKYLQGSLKTYAIEAWAVCRGNAKTRDAMKFYATGKGNENTSDECNTSAREAIRTIGLVHAGSESTQNSVAFSSRGLANVGKAFTRPAMKNAVPVPCDESELLPVMLQRLEQLGEQGRAIAFAKRGQA
jgi:hypothetical protein